MSSTSNLSIYLDKRVISIFILGILSGLPWVMIGSALSLWLKESGISRTNIGFAGLIFTVYAVNFLWAPLVDKFHPKIQKGIGHRRSWVLICQVAIAGACYLMSTTSPESNATLVVFFGLVIACFSATQDIAIDAYRVDQFTPKEPEYISAAAAATTAGWWTGYAGLGYIPLMLSDLGWAWPHLYLLLGAMTALLAGFVLFSPDPPRKQPQTDTPLFTTPNSSIWLPDWLSSTLVAPLKDFFDRNGVKLAISLLLFIFLFKIGEAFLGRMSIIFYKEVGFTNTEIASYSKMLTWGITVAAAIPCGLLNARFGLIKGLFISGICMAASNLMFAGLAIVGPNLNLYLATIIVDGITTAWASVAFVSFISMLCSHSFSATQYALLASLGSLGRTTVASFSGKLVDTFNGNWALFFIITALMVIPGLILLISLKGRLQSLYAGASGQAKDT